MRKGLRSRIFRRFAAGLICGTVGISAFGWAWAGDLPRLDGANRSSAAGAVQQGGYTTSAAVKPGAVRQTSGYVNYAGAYDPAVPPPPAPGVQNNDPGMPAQPGPGPQVNVAAPEEPAEEEGPWGLTDLFTDACGQNWWKENGWKMGGSIVQSYTFNFNSPNDKFNGPVTGLDRSNEYQLNQSYFYLEKATKTDECKDWDLGGRVDLLYGTNYRWTTSAGFEDTWDFNTDRSFYGLAIPQLYAEVAYKDTKTKIGHWYSPVGYFVVDTTQNFFNTLPYTFQYGEPFTHWGFITSTSLTDRLDVSAGMMAGWDNLDGSGTGSDSAGFVGTWTYKLSDDSTLAYVGCLSNEFNNNFTGVGSRMSTRYMQTLVYQTKLNECWRYVFQTDFGTQNDTNDFSGTRDIGTARWYGINQYLFYKQNKCWEWGVNAEWFRDEGGFRVGSALPTATTPGSQVRGLPGDRFGYAGNFFQVTVGPKWTPNDNLFVRPNLRFDWFDGDSVNPGARQPFDDGNKDTQVILGLDVGITY